MALYQRERTGLGGRINVSMLDTVFSILETGVMQYTLKGVISKPEGNRDPVIAPFDSFEAKDGMFVMACGTEKFWLKLCDAMNMPELATDPHFATNTERVNNYPLLKGTIEAWSKELTLCELENIICAAGIPFGRIQNVKQACESELIKNRNMLWTVDDPAFGHEIKVPGTPIKMHGCEDAPKKAAPLLGEDTEHILTSILGIDSERIAELREIGAI